MFAELEPEAVSRRVVDGNIVEASSAASDAPGDTVDGEREAARLWSDSQASAEGWTLDSGLPAEMRRLRDFEAAPAVLTRDAGPGYERDAVDEGDAPPVATLESLEQGFTASGFSNMELRPGELAALVGQPMPPEANDGAPSIFSGPLVETGAAYAAPAAPSEPESAFVEDEPEPSDYAGRLDRARGRRANGQLEDALGEYRVILKNAPDLLAEIVSELQESMMAAPENPEVHRLLGDARIREGDYLSALESYNRAVALTQAQGM
jgi:tetratricopeptide (TPR) repeat protein